MSGAIPGMGGMIVGGIAAVVCTAEYQASATDTVSPFSQIISTGLAASDRLVVCVVHWDTSGNPTLSSLKIDGHTATIHVQKQDGNGTGVAICSYPIPTGTTSTFVATFSGAIDRMGFAVYSITGQVSNTPTATQTDSTSTGTSDAVTIAVQANGVVIAGVSMSNHTRVGWTNATEQYDANMPNSGGMAGALYASAGISENRTITASFSSDDSAFVAAAWH